MPFRRKGTKVVDSREQGPSRGSSKGGEADTGATEGPDAAAAGGRRNQPGGGAGRSPSSNAYEEPTRKAPSRGGSSGSGRRTKDEDASEGPTRRVSPAGDQTPTSESADVQGASEQEEELSPVDDTTPRKNSPATESTASDSDRRQVNEAKTQILRGGKRPSQADSSQVDASSSGVETEDGAHVVEDPPAGWLVIVNGPGKGRAVQVGVGANQIGSDPSQRIPVNFGDTAISRESHALLVYDPNSRRFFINHGSGKNLTYLNGDLIMTPTEIQSHAEIQLGNTVFRFVPLCGEAFDWSEYE